MNRNLYIKFVIGYCLSFILTKFLKMYINEKRPINCTESTRMCATPGMPSGTALRSGYLLGFAIGIFGTSMSKYQYLLILLFTMSITYSRVVVNAHSIKQIAVGYVIGTLLGMVVSVF